VIDGDEAITNNLQPHIRGYFSQLVPLQSLDLPMVAAWHSPTTRRVDPCVWTRATINIGWCDSPRAAWAATNGYHLHSRMPAHVRHRSKKRTDGGVVHFQFADHERLKWKHRWYKLHEAVVYREKNLADIDGNYDQALDERNLELSDIPTHWRWEHEDRIRIGIGSWHEAECEQLYHEAEKMNRASGLNLWGWP
jgi:hypothetical protein